MYIDNKYYLFDIISLRWVRQVVFPLSLDYKQEQLCLRRVLQIKVKM